MSAQPLHPSIIPKLDPEYVDFHNKHLAQIVSPHTIPWNSVTRNAVAMPGTSDPLDVGSTEDIALSKCNIRVFTPPSSRPSQGWPAYVVCSSVEQPPLSTVSDSYFITEVMFCLICDPVTV